MNKFKNIEVSHLVVKAAIGAVISECMKECISLAAREWRDVTLIHSGKEYKISTDALMTSIQFDD